MNSMKITVFVFTSNEYKAKNPGRRGEIQAGC